MAETHRTRRVALTGGIATGKSHVRAMLESLGVPTIDADVLARDAVAPGTSGLAAVTACFGEEVLRPDGTLDRQWLAQTIFADASARRQLEAIVHPAVRIATDAWFETLDRAGAAVGVADIPLLYEVGRDPDFDQVIVTSCNGETQLRRLMERDNLPAPAARARIAAQLPIEEKTRRADYVINTDGTTEDTDRQVRELVSSWQH